MKIHRIGGCFKIGYDGNRSAWFGNKVLSQRSEVVMQRPNGGSRSQKQETMGTQKARFLFNPL